MSDPRTGRGSGTAVLRLTTSSGAEGIAVTGAPPVRISGTRRGGPAQDAAHATMAKCAAVDLRIGDTRRLMSKERATQVRYGCNSNRDPSTGRAAPRAFFERGALEHEPHGLVDLEPTEGSRVC